MGERARSVGVVVAGTLVLACVGACGGPAAPTATAPTAPASAAPATTTAAATTAPTGARPLARVFPDVADPTCVPADSSVRTGTGVVPTEAYTCDYASVAAGAEVIFAQWPDQAGAQAWYDDTAALGPRVEEFDNWQVAGVNQGPLYTAQNTNKVVISTGVYQDLPYTWEIRTSTLEESNAVFNQLSLLQSTAIAG
jgi:serine/threonine-protein kinase